MHYTHYNIIVKFVLTSWIVLYDPIYYTRQYYIYKKGSLSVKRFFWLAACFFDIWNKSTVSTISAENHRKITCFLSRPHFFNEATKKKNALDKRHTNRIGVELTTCGSCEKRGRNGFPRGKIGFVGDTRAKARIARASSYRALRLFLSPSPRTLAWPKGLN